MKVSNEFQCGLHKSDSKWAFYWGTEWIQDFNTAMEEGEQKKQKLLQANFSICYLNNFTWKKYV